MDCTTIEWSSTVVPYSNVQDSGNGYLDNNGFYIILTGKYSSQIRKYVDIKLQYIGKAYAQSIRERVQQEHDAYIKIDQFLKKNSGYSALVRPGIIIELSQQRVTPQIVDDIEACLIFCNQPPANTLNKDKYSGRDIAIINTGGYYPLEEISCSS
ncbi:MAG: hypothetical protein FWD14_04455 [Treponema sp.]|nr:hypothetical protein [Treponema sp.]